MIKARLNDLFARRLKLFITLFSITILLIFSSIQHKINTKNINMTLYPEFYEYMESETVTIKDNVYDKFFTYDENFQQSHSLVVDKFYDSYNSDTFRSLSVTYREGETKEDSWLYITIEDEITSKIKRHTPY